VDNLEVGLKTQLFDRQLTLNAALYHMIWNDVQVQRIDSSGAFGYVDNAGKAKLYGVEFEGSFRPRSLARFSADFSLRLSSQKLSVNNPNAETDPTLGRKGDDIPNAIPLQASLGVQQGFDLVGREAYARFDVTYTGKTHSAFNSFDPDYFAYGDYVMVNGRVGIEDDNWNAALYVSNLFNVREVQSYTASYAEPWAFFSQPREIGVRLGFRF
jgi:outer membrane receptor protein involved in Fe transport